MLSMTRIVNYHIGSLYGARALSSTSSPQNNWVGRIADFFSPSPTSNSSGAENKEKREKLNASKLMGVGNKSSNSITVLRNINEVSTEAFIRNFTLHAGIVGEQQNPPSLQAKVGGDQPTEDYQKLDEILKRKGFAEQRGIYLIDAKQIMLTNDMNDRKMTLLTTVGAAAWNASNSILLKFEVDTNALPIFREAKNNRNLVCFTNAEIIQFDEESLRKVQITCAKTGRVFTTIDALRAAYEKGIN